MKKKEFVALYNACQGASAAIFNKLGLTCKKFNKHVASIYENIQDDELLISYDFGAKEGDTFKRNQNQSIIIKSECQKDFDKKIKELFNQELSKKEKELVASFEKIKVPAEILGNLQPNLFDILNGFIYSHTDDEYLAALQAEKEKRG